MALEHCKPGASWQERLAPPDAADLETRFFWEYEALAWGTSTHSERCGQGPVRILNAIALFAMLLSVQWLELRIPWLRGRISRPPL